MNDETRNSETRDGDTGSTGIDERLIGALRAPEVLAPDFEARLMAQARAEIARRRATTARRSWWVTGRVFVASPLTAFAMAAGIALAAAASTLVVTRRSQPTIAVKRDTVEFVRFVLVDSTARSVSVVGDFNGWKRDETPLNVASKAGVWSVSLPLAPGRHEYAFIVDGKRWVIDPASIASSDEFGTESSVLVVSPARIDAS